MRDDTPHDFDELDDRLTGLPRLEPGRGFANRVLGRVRHPLPTWLIPVRNWYRNTTSGVRGWLLLIAMSLTSLGTWGTLGIVAWRERAQVAVEANRAVADLAGPTVQGVNGVRDVVSDIIRDRLFDWLPLSLVALKYFLVIYAAVALVCVVGLWWLTRTPRAAEVQHGT